MNLDISTVKIAIPGSRQTNEPAKKDCGKVLLETSIGEEYVHGLRQTRTKELVESGEMGDFHKRFQYSAEMIKESK